MVVGAHIVKVLGHVVVVEITLELLVEDLGVVVVLVCGKLHSSEVVVFVVVERLLVVVILDV